jgi:aryl-phospho-beta-D-glucosidase BglC (GH1 family)
MGHDQKFTPSSRFLGNGVLHRREFIRTVISAASAGIAGTAAFSRAQIKSAPGNPLPRWRGFNLLDYFLAKPYAPHRTTDEDLTWMVDWGFDFVRLPMAYPRYIDFDKSKNITPSDVYKINEREVDAIEALVRKAQDRGLHVSINLHRAPGYCINAGFQEPYDLWKSKEAQDAFAFHWSMWGKRFKDLPASKISFDLLNEPAVRADLNDQTAPTKAVPGETYRIVATTAADAIRAANPKHLVIADGNKIGMEVTPELRSLRVAQSCRGYFPGYVSHYRAPWANKDPEKCPTPVWPGTMNGEKFDKTRLVKFYAPWIELAQSGTGVHCGECGCWNQTPHEVFLAWFTDVLEILASAGIGYALWNFRGDFGILDSGRKDVEYQDWYGHKLDRKLLEMLKRH